MKQVSEDITESVRRKPDFLPTVELLYYLPLVMSSCLRSLSPVPLSTTYNLPFILFMHFTFNNYSFQFLKFYYFFGGGKSARAYSFILS